jgi:23S rRNA pseudouridine2605 synthase
MRINKFVALANKVARRKADELVMSSQIKVNGKTAKNGQDIDETKDRVEMISETGLIQKLGIVSMGAPKVLLMYKPVKIVTSHEREGGNKTIFELLPEHYQGFKFAGRLDLMSEGLLVLSNDGGVVQTLSHPRYGHTKKYLVITERKLTPAEIRYLSNGVDIEGYLTKPSKIVELMQSPSEYKKYSFLGLNSYQPTYIFTLSEGRNQQIRKMLFAVQTKVKRLIRVEYGEYQLDARLLKGQLREIPWKQGIFAKKKEGFTSKITTNSRRGGARSA